MSLNLITYNNRIIVHMFFFFLPIPIRSTCTTSIGWFFEHRQDVARRAGRRHAEGEAMDLMDDLHIMVGLSISDYILL